MIFAVALIAVALTAKPAESPKEQGFPKAKVLRVQLKLENPSKSQEPAKTSNPPSAPTPSGTSEPAAAAGESKRDAETENENVQRWIEVFTGLLVLVGAAQAGIMLLQWRIYTRQAREMRRSRHEMRRQRHVMYQQWQAIREQVGEMSAQRGIMGRQLTTMDNQADEMKDQTEALKQSVAVAKESADAALRAVKLQEVQLEQWIDTEDWDTGPMHVQPDATEAFLPIRFAITNTTRFKLILDSVDIWIDRELAASVYFRKQLLTPDGGSTTAEIQRKLSGMKLESWRKGSYRFELGGIVFFADAFGKAQEQKFGFHGSCGLHQPSEFKPIAFYPPDAEEVEQQKRRKASAQQKETN